MGAITRMITDYGMYVTHPQYPLGLTRNVVGGASLPCPVGYLAVEWERKPTS